MAAMDRRYPLPAEQPVLVRDLPLLSGASKEAVAFATGFLSRHGYAVAIPMEAEVPLVNRPS
jgi:hypothetical protein